MSAIQAKPQGLLTPETGSRDGKRLPGPLKRCPAERGDWGGRITGLHGWKQQRSCSARGLLRGRSRRGAERLWGLVPVQSPAKPEEAWACARVGVGVPADALLQSGSSNRSLTVVHFHSLPFWNELVIPGQLRDCLTTDEGVFCCLMELCPPSPLPRVPSLLVT